MLFGGCLSCLWAWWEKNEVGKRKKNPKDKSNFQLTAENLGHANAEMQKETTSKRGTAQTRLPEK